jgi:hypothetical protein
MKTRLVLYTIFLVATDLQFCIKSSFGQNLDTLLQYYPLNNGDYWEYSEEKIDPINNEYEQEAYSLEVMGDTLFFYNAKKYKMIEKHHFDLDSSEFLFERLDTTTANIYRYDKSDLTDDLLIDSLKLLPNEEFEGFSRYTSLFAIIYFSSFGVDTLFDEPVYLRTYRASDIIFDYEYTFALNIGLINASAVSPELTWQKRWRLIYAKVNGKEYDFKTRVRDINKTARTFKLFTNYPNPFNSQTIIKYFIPKVGIAQLKIFNLNGKEVITLFDREMNPGEDRMIWNGKDRFGAEVSSGIYFVCLKVNESIKTQKVLLIR